MAVLEINLSYAFWVAESTFSASRTKISPRNPKKKLFVRHWCRKLHFFVLLNYLRDRLTWGSIFCEFIIIAEMN